MYQLGLPGSLNIYSVLLLSQRNNTISFLLLLHITNDSGAGTTSDFGVVFPWTKPKIALMLQGRIMFLAAYLHHE